MKSVEISNWDDLVDVVGLDRAKIISRKLWEKQDGHQFTEIDVDPEKTEAICLFELLPVDCHHKVYEFQGTAN